MTGLMAGGYLGGYLTLSKGVGPAQTVFDRPDGLDTGRGRISAR